MDAVDRNDSLAHKLALIRGDIKDEYKQPHGKPWILGFSGGKDSTLVLHLLFEVLLALSPSQRSRMVHVLANDTLVESPLVIDFVDKTLDKVNNAAQRLQLPIKVVKSTPTIDNSFWVNLIGRGYPAPNRQFRWCTDRMKIRPTSDYIKSLAGEAGEVILLLGVRRTESAQRAKVMKRYDNGARLNLHNDLAGCFVYRPIVDLETQEVWIALLQLRPPWGGTHRDLVTLYRNAQDGECPLVVDQDSAPSCGTNSPRFGCWTCTVVEKDRSMRGHIESGAEELEPLADFRDWLKAFSRDPKNRMARRRSGQLGLGPLTFKAREEVLTRLQALQQLYGRELIRKEEVVRIEQIWRDDECMILQNKARRLLRLLDKTA